MSDPLRDDGEDASRSAPPRAGDGSRYRVPAAARTLSLLEFLASAREPQGVSAVARRLGIPKSSCFALLSTLEEADYVRRNARDEWALTLKIYHVGVSAHSSRALRRT